MITGARPPAGVSINSGLIGNLLLALTAVKYAFFTF
jgi:hypothetical protein